MLFADIIGFRLKGKLYNAIVAISCAKPHNGHNPSYQKQQNRHSDTDEDVLDWSIVWDSAVARLTAIVDHHLICFTKLIVIKDLVNKIHTFVHSQSVVSMASKGILGIEGGGCGGGQSLLSDEDLVFVAAVKLYFKWKMATVVLPGHLLHSYRGPHSRHQKSSEKQSQGHDDGMNAWKAVQNRKMLC